MQRMRSVGTKVYLTGPVANLRQGGIPGLDTPDALRSVPSDWSGGIWTNRIDVIGPLVAARYRREGKAN
jgi:glycerophosphoryl diester phosphodiesterase